MYPKIRVDKLHPDGTRRASWEAYRIDDHDGAKRVWTPARTPRIHVNGRWQPDSPIITAWKPGEPFVAAMWEEAGGFELYIDIVREVIVTPTRFAFVDLYVDVMLNNGAVTTKDEELLERLTPEEARAVTTTCDRLVRAVAAGEPPFRMDDACWRVSDDIRALPAGVWLTL
jgi:hypothetical protein